MYALLHDFPPDFPARPLRGTKCTFQLRPMYPSSFSPRVQNVLFSYGRCTPPTRTGTKVRLFTFSCRESPSTPAPPRSRPITPSHKIADFSVHGNDITGDLLLVVPYEALLVVRLSSPIFSCPPAGSSEGRRCELTPTSGRRRGGTSIEDRGWQDKDTTVCGV